MVVRKLGAVLGCLAHAGCGWQVHDLPEEAQGTRFTQSHAPLSRRCRLQGLALFLLAFKSATVSHFSIARVPSFGVHNPSVPDVSSAPSNPDWVCSGTVVMCNGNRCYPPLGSRLEAVYALVPRRNGLCRVADIGSDHSTLSIELARRGADTVIAVDRSEAALMSGIQNKAISLLDEKEFCENGVKFRLGNGLSVLDPGEVDTVCIAGVGTGGILKILFPKEEINRLRELRVSHLVLQPAPRHARPETLANLRHWLSHNGWKIEDENIVFSQGRYYVTLKAVDSTQVASKHDKHQCIESCLLPMPIRERVRNKDNAEYEIYEQYLKFNLRWASSAACNSDLMTSDGWSDAEDKEQYMYRHCGEIRMKELSAKLVAETLERELDELAASSPERAAEM